MAAGGACASASCRSRRGSAGRKSHRPSSPLSFLFPTAVSALRARARAVAHQAKSSLGAEASRVRNVDLVSGDITPEIGHDVVKLWEDEGVQKAWAKKASY